MKIPQSSSGSTGGNRRDNSRLPSIFRGGMGRFFDDFDIFDDFLNRALIQPFSQDMTGWAPDIDLSSNEKEIRLQANIPGFDPKNISVEIEEGRVILQGKHEEGTEEPDARYYRRERTMAAFYREIALPPDADTARAESQIKNGVLTITIPRKEQKDRKALKIKVEQ